MFPAVLDKGTNLTIGYNPDEMINIDIIEVEDSAESKTSWTFLLQFENKTRFVEFLQNGNDGFLNLCEVEIYGTKGKQGYLCRNILDIQKLFRSCFTIHMCLFNQIFLFIRL